MYLTSIFRYGLKREPFGFCFFFQIEYFLNETDPLCGCSGRARCH